MHCNGLLLKAFFLIWYFLSSQVNANLQNVTKEQQEYDQEPHTRVKRFASATITAIALTAGSTLAGVSAQGVSQALGMSIFKFNNVKPVPVHGKLQ